MFRNVLVGVDGTPNGRDAIALASALAAPDARITLAHIDAGPQTPSRISNQLLHAFHESSRQDSLRLLEAERDATGVSADLITAAGPVGRGLHTLAAEHAVDLLVVGSCGRGRVGRAVIGDDTRAALNGAPCAVAIAPHGYAAGPVELETVGVGYDFNDESHAALAVARDVAAQHLAHVTALHVVAQPIGAYASPLPSDWGQILEDERQHAAERLHTLEHVDASAIYGAPFEELAAFGEHVDLLVVGSRSYGPLKRLVLGSTSSHLTRHAHCALLVIPRSAAMPTEHANSDTGARVGAPS
jgi:nucleotide-binding universal stress UspA family protein